MFLGHGVDQTLAQPADLLVGEGAVGSPEAQAEGEALLVGAEGVGTEDVEQADVLEEVAGRAGQGALGGAGRDGLVEDEGQVDGRRRVAGRRDRPPLLPGGGRGASTG